MCKGFELVSNDENDVSDDGDITADDQENIEEAIHHVNTALLPSRVSRLPHGLIIS